MKSRTSRFCGLVTALALLFCSPEAGLAAEKTVLTLVSATDTKAFAPVLARFEAENPDITLDYREFSSRELADMVRADSLAPRGEIDLVISSATDLQVTLVNDGLALPHASPYAARLPHWAQWRGELYGFTWEPLVLAWNRALLPPELLPDSRAELAGLINREPERLQGRIGTYDIESSGAGYLFATQDALQSNDLLPLIGSLGRVQARIFCCTSLILEEIAAGRLLLGYNLIGSYAIEAAKKNPDIGIVLLRDYTIVMSRTLFIYRHSRHPEEAGRFVDFLLSPAGQAEIARSSALIPIDEKLRTARLPEASRISWLPVKLGVSLLTWQDRMKKETFLRIWRSVFRKDL